MMMQDMQDMPEMADKAVDLALTAGCDPVDTARMCAAILTGNRSPKLPTHPLPPKRVDSGLALRLLGRRVEIHPRDVIAFSYRSPELADLSEFLNREWYGHEIAGRVMLDNGILIVLDLRPSHREQGMTVTDPARPDDWRGR